MTLSDPLLKELKGHIAKLVISGSPPYGDENENVFLICHCIEAIFLKGLKRYDGFTPWRTDCFSWFYQLIRKYQKIISSTYKLAFEEVLNDPRTKTSSGKTRLLIRTCLKRRLLHIPVQLHVEYQDHEDESLRINYIRNGSIMGHEILSQIFLSLLQQLGQYDFNLDLTNASFLDESWQIPRRIQVQFVPCERLGLTLGFPLGFAVIVEIIEHSLAAEVSGSIAVGDIMDEFNGTVVRNFYGSKIESLFRKHKSKPFSITFIKATDNKGKLYLPAIKLYRILGMDPERVAFSKQTNGTSEPKDEIDLEMEQSDQDYSFGENQLMRQKDEALVDLLIQPASEDDLLGQVDETGDSQQSHTHTPSRSPNILSDGDSRHPITTDKGEASATVQSSMDLLIDIDLNATTDELVDLLGISEDPALSSLQSVQLQFKEHEDEIEKLGGAAQIEEKRGPQQSQVSPEYTDDGTSPFMA